MPWEISNGLNAKAFSREIIIISKKRNFSSYFYLIFICSHENFNFFNSRKFFPSICSKIRKTQSLYPKLVVTIFFFSQYLAPEVLRKQSYDKSVDWWCLGAVTYEMMYGLPPFYSRDTAEMYDNILHKPLRLRTNISQSARHLLEQVRLSLVCLIRRFCL